MKLQWFISFWVIFLSLGTSALSQTNTRTANEGKFGFRLSSGMGQYSSLVVPAQLGSLQEVAAIQANMQGIPVSLELEKPLQSDYGLAIGGSGLFMSALAGPDGRQDSSYRLWRLWSGAQEAVTWSILEIGPRATAQRQTFMNVSTGHNVDSLLLGLTMSLNGGGNWSLESNAGYAAWAQIGYNDGKSFASKPLKGSQARVWVWDMSGKRTLSRNASLLLEYSLENSTVVINDFDSYRPYGLAQPAGFGSDVTMRSTYYLQAQSVRLGFEKHW
ncbi:MAG: hypothetical protein AB7T49_00395 [Oligoflexales bacterium]